MYQIHRVAVLAVVITFFASGSAFSADKYIRITKPQGGETFYPGDTIWIEWSDSGLAQDAIAIQYSLDGGTNYAPLNTDGVDRGHEFYGNYPFVPDYKCSSDSVFIVVSEYESPNNYYEVTDLFSLKFKEPNLFLQSPTMWLEKVNVCGNGSEGLEINWCADNLTNGTVNLYISLDNKSTWTKINSQPIPSGPQDAKTYTYRPTIDDTGKSAHLKIEDAGNPSGYEVAAFNKFKIVYDGVCSVNTRRMMSIARQSGIDMSITGKKVEIAHQPSILVSLYTINGSLVNRQKTGDSGRFVHTVQSNGNYLAVLGSGAQNRRVAVFAVSQ
ncbi:MAG: hypothetical protein GF398_03180 [Chitinivibrionales bacterium]|nr:hypothetical protein [Chitinivibrionales bacterium]